MNATDDDVLMVSADEAARRLALSTAHVYRLVRSGALERRYIGKGRHHFRIPVASLRDYVDGLPTEPEPAD